VRDTPPDAKTNAATALAAFLFLAATAWVSVALAGPPGAVPESAPASAFSSARALRHVRAFARKAHPTGSEEIERVRRYILDELSSLGVSAEVESVEVVPRQAASGFPVPAARVQNVVARVPGTAGGGKALMLAAHYDSVPTGPGASDDGAGVAALLETIRALKSGPPLRNDLIFVFTDAEELGLLGARGFAGQNPLMKSVALVLNFEARGAGGPSMMFETSEGNGALIRELAATPHPVANSLMYAVYKRLPNDTDMTVFKGAGAAGLNFAYTDRITSYHTALDNADELDERSLQHHGSYALSLARRFGDLDLDNLKSRDAVYFNPLGPVLIHYSEAWVTPLTVLVCLLFAVVLFVGLKRRRLSIAGIAAGVVAFALAAVLPVLLTTAVWRAARGLHAGYALLPWRTPYDIWPYALGFVLLTVAAFAAVYALLFRETNAASLSAGALLCWLALLILTTALLSPGSFLFAWPLLFALAAFAALVFARDDGFESPKGLTLAALAAAPGVCLFAPLVWMFFFLLGLDPGGPFMLLVVLLCGLVVPHFRALTFRRRWLLPALAALAACGLVAVGLARTGFDARHKKTDSVFYLLDSDTQRARWLSTDAAPDEWTSQFIPADAGRESLAGVFPWMRQQVRAAEAPAAQLPAPDVQVLEDRAEGDVRTLRLRLTSARRAPMLLFYVEPASDIRRASLDGQTLLDESPRAESKTPRAEGETQRAAGDSSHVAGDSSRAAVGASRAESDARASLRVSFAAPPPEGLELLLETRAGARVRLTVEDLSYGLPELPGQTLRPRPADAMPVPSYRTSDTTVVRRALDLPPRSDAAQP
jgi:Peptidase family M28